MTYKSGCWTCEGLDREGEREQGCLFMSQVGSDRFYWGKIGKGV